MDQAKLPDTLSDFLESLRLKGLAENTALSYKRDLKKYFNYCEAHDIAWDEQYTEAVVRDFFMDLKQKENQKPATLARCKASLRSYFQYLHSQGVVEHNPIDQLPVPKVEQSEPHILQPEEVDRLLQEAQGTTKKALRDSAMLELLYATGIRVSELIQLRLEDVNLNLEYVICQQKRRGRVVPFGKTAKKALEAYLNEARPQIVKDGDCELFFTNLRGQQMTRQGVWKLLRQYGKQAGIEGEITPHTLRHSFAAHLVRNGADLFAVQEMMGYTNLAGTQAYAKMRPASIREAYTKANIRD